MDGLRGVIANAMWSCQILSNDFEHPHSFRLAIVVVISWEHVLLIARIQTYKIYTHARIGYASIFVLLNDTQ